LVEQRFRTSIVVGHSPKEILISAPDNLQFPYVIRSVKKFAIYDDIQEELAKLNGKSPVEVIVAGDEIVGISIP